MIGKKSDSEKINISEIEFVIAYDKFTKPAAISLKNQLSTAHKCVVWSKKDYLDHESSYTNKNHIIIFNEDLIKENLANPSLSHHEIIPGIDYIKEGNAIGIVFNEASSPKKLKDILKENWGKYSIGIIAPLALVGGIPGALVISWLLTLSQKKKIKFKLYMDAVDRLATGTLNGILNG